MRGFGGSLTKFYLSKVVQQWTMKHSGNPHDSLNADRYLQAKNTAYGK